MPDTVSKLREILRATENARKGLQGTQAYAEDHVWSQIGQAINALKDIERKTENVIREYRESTDA